MIGGDSYFFQFLETEGGGKVPHLPKFPKDIRRGVGGESKSLEIDPVFTISSPYIQTSLIFRGLSSLIKQTEGDITLSRLSIHQCSAFPSPMTGMIRRTPYYCV